MYNDTDLCGDGGSMIYSMSSVYFARRALMLSNLCEARFHSSSSRVSSSRGESVLLSTSVTILSDSFLTTISGSNFVETLSLISTIVSLSLGYKMVKKNVFYSQNGFSENR